MERRAQLLKSLIFQVFLVIFFTAAPSFVDVLLPTPTVEETTTSTSIADPTQLNLSAANLAEPLKNALTVVQGVAVTVGMLGILFTGVRLAFSVFTEGTSGSTTSSYESIRARRQREAPQPSVADALEGMLATQNSSSQVNSSPTQPEPEPVRSQRGQETKEDISSSHATRVIRESDSSEEKEDTTDDSGEVKRIIRS
ncbi:hypothetical protein [Paenibacillus taichungensis]